MSVFLKLMRLAGNPGFGRLFANKRQKGWRVLDDNDYDRGVTLWMVSKSGEWDLFNGPKGSSRRVLRELVESRFRISSSLVAQADCPSGSIVGQRS